MCAVQGSIKIHWGPGALPVAWGPPWLALCPTTVGPIPGRCSRSSGQSRMCWPTGLGAGAAATLPAGLHWSRHRGCGATARWVHVAWTELWGWPLSPPQLRPAAAAPGSHIPPRHTWPAWPLVSSATKQVPPFINPLMVLSACYFRKRYTCSGAGDRASSVIEPCRDLGLSAGVQNWSLSA